MNGRISAAVRRFRHRGSASVSRAPAVPDPGPPAPAAVRAPEGWPPGHFYSPIPSLDEVERREGELFGPAPPEVPGVALNVPGQLALLRELARYYPEQPFPEQRRPERRYYFENDYFSYGEALVYHALLRHLRPARVVEIGSGFSSAALLDTRELFLDRELRCTFIEPYPERLLSLLRPGDLETCALVREPLQAVAAALFTELEAGDILFVDSTHVAKIGSDVQQVFFRILPRLRSGVWIHFHDIYYPFEYPRHWVYQGRAWNEAYVLRAFLQYNGCFEILFFNAYLAEFHGEALRNAMPLAARCPGSSFWMRRR